MKQRRSQSDESEVIALARRLAGRPCNRHGADKTWVLRLLENMQQFFASVRSGRTAPRR